MATLFYPEHSKLYASQYLEIMIPISYFADKFAVNKGSCIETLGILFLRTDKDKTIKLFTVPTIIELNVVDTEEDSVTVHGKHIPVLIMKYLKGSYVMHQTIPQSRDIAAVFTDYILAGKLPNVISYTKLVDLWWRNLEISGVSYKVPSKIFELILANIYRSPNNMKKRYGQYYGKQANPTGLDYKTGNVRDIVESLSTFSGMVFEDINRMITSGIDNTLNQVEEPVSPLEKIIHL